MDSGRVSLGKRNRLGGFINPTEELLRLCSAYSNSGEIGHMLGLSGQNPIFRNGLILTNIFISCPVKFI